MALVTNLRLSELLRATDSNLARDTRSTSCSYVTRGATDVNRAMRAAAKGDQLVTVKLCHDKLNATDVDRPWPRLRSMAIKASCRYAKSGRPGDAGRDE